MTVSVALIALGVNFLDNDFSWSGARCCLAVAYCLLALTVILSLWSMAAVSDFLPKSPTVDSPTADCTARVILPANTSFFMFAAAVVLLTVVRVKEITAERDQEQGASTDVMVIFWQDWNSV